MTGSSDFSHLLMCSSREPIPEPTVTDIHDWLALLNNADSVVLYKADHSHIRADGARAKFTIAYYQTARTPPLLVGRGFNEHRHGRATLDGDRVVVTPHEYWSTEDGFRVFDAFLRGTPLSDEFVLRDPRTAYSQSEIEQLLTEKAPLPVKIVP